MPSARYSWRPVKRSGSECPKKNPPKTSEVEGLITGTAR
jgi:hypothetical protein